MGDEIERLKADLEVLQRHQGYSILENAIADITDKIAQIEAEAADPWREAKETIARWRNFSVDALYVDQIVPYFDNLTTEVADLKQKYDLANSTIRIATDRLNEVKAENDRLEKRVKELEAEIKAEDDADIADAERALADMQPPFEGPIVGIEPVLDPARVLATAAKILAERGQPGIAKIVCKGIHGAPYKLKRGDK